MQVAYESRTEAAHHARTDRFAELDEMSFAELVSLEAELSEGNSWSLHDDVKAEIAERVSDAEDKLAKLFVQQCTFAGGSLPMPAGGKVCSWIASVYLTESFGDAKWGSMVSDVLLGLRTREELLRAMAEEYASEQAEDLLKAGWSAEQ